MRRAFAIQIYMSVRDSNIIAASKNPDAADEWGASADNLRRRSSNSAAIPLYN